MKFVRKLYDWMLHWANTPFGPAALFLLAVAESSFFPIPPDALLIALALGMRAKSFKFAFLCAAGSIIGALIGYGIGYYLWWRFSQNLKYGTSGSFLPPDLLQFHLKYSQFLQVHLM